MFTDVQRLKRRVKLRDLETLMTVASAGGMRRAAEALHLSQPAVSKSIASLENALGVKLLERSRRGIEVTRSGTSLIGRAEAMFYELQQGLRELAHLADPAGGEIHLACSETLNAGIASAAMERMARLYPRVVFSIDSGDADVLVSHYLQRLVAEFVLARPNSATLDPAVRAEPLFRERLQVVGGVHSQWARRRKLTLAELAGEPWILSRNETAVGSPVELAFRNCGLPMPRLCMLSSSLNVRYTLLVTGRYVTVMPRSLLRFGGARQLVKVLPVEVGQWQTPTMIMSPANRSFSPASAAYLDIVRELARQLDD
ncbi:MAG: HTH-type transcriptional regulator TsaR [Burkholderiaceae bacterium]|nr:HTH-type transcriptional regulator TsaR [Burkholderiaceae bacterium]